MDDLFADSALRGQQLDRRAIERLAGAPQKLVDCDLEAVDLSRLDLSDWTFERCSFRKTDLAGATLERTDWQSCRSAFANFTGADFTDATLIACDFNNASLKAIGPRLIYRVSPKLAYVNDTGGGCEAVARGDALITRQYSSRLCRGDIARTRDMTTRIDSGSCVMGSFVPYRGS